MIGSENGKGLPAAKHNVYMPLSRRETFNSASQGAMPSKFIGVFLVDVVSSV